MNKGAECKQTSKIWEEAFSIYYLQYPSLHLHISRDSSQTPLLEQTSPEMMGHVVLKSVPLFEYSVEREIWYPQSPRVPVLPMPSLLTKLSKHLQYPATQVPRLEHGNSSRVPVLLRKEVSKLLAAPFATSVIDPANGLLVVISRLG